MNETHTAEYCSVTIHGNKSSLVESVPVGSDLYAILISLGMTLNAPCGGNGTCGKCVVRIAGGAEEGFRLACNTRVSEAMEVWLPDPEAEMKILSRGRRRERALAPLVRKTVLSLDSLAAGDHASDAERLIAGWMRARHPMNENRARPLDSQLALSELRKLHEIFKSGIPELTVVDVADRLVAVEPGDTSKTNYCVAFDIGTTTLAGYLVDLNSGEELAASVSANPQRVFGADVISRIGYTMRDPSKLAEMNRVLVNEINTMIGGFETTAHIASEEIYAATFVGNTTMMHFLMGLPADGIAMAPFIPVTTELTFLPAAELGLSMNKSGSVLVLPAVSAYVGADTVAAVFSTGMHTSAELSLLVDIGTNGEIVLGNKDKMVACSAAAGPAFEGAGIRNGVSSVAGAIDGVRLHPEFKISTIGDVGAVGICGSGIVDAVAEMRTVGIVNERGRFNPDPSTLPSAIQERLTEISGQKAFLLANKDESLNGIEIAVTQKDVRELQNAKAAIAAGIHILSSVSGIRLDRVERVYLAGGFGSYIDVDNAMKIGLLPKELEGRIEAVGNAAGSGAVESLLSREALFEKQAIKERIEYIELSYTKEFLAEYMNCMKL